MSTSTRLVFSATTPSGLTYKIYMTTTTDQNGTSSVYFSDYDASITFASIVDVEAYMNNKFPASTLNPNPAPTPATKDSYGNDLSNTRKIFNTVQPSDLGGENNVNMNQYTWGTLQREGVVMMDFQVLQGAYSFQGEDRGTFSPFSVNPYSFENLAVAALFLKGMTKNNFKDLTGLVSDYMQNVARIFESISHVGRTNPVATGSALLLLSSMAQRFGFINNGGLVRVQEHIRTTYDKDYLLSLFTAGMNGVTTLVEGSKVSGGKDASGDYANAGGLPALLAGLKP